MVNKWNVDVERKRSWFGNFVLTCREQDSGLTLEIANGPGLSADAALELASEAMKALADAIREQREIGNSAMAP